MMPAGSPFFCLRLSGFLSNWKLTGSTSGFKASKIFEKQHRNRIQPDYLSQSTSKFETGLKGSDIFLSAFISQKWKIYNLWKSFIFCLTTPTLRCKLGLIKIDEQKSNHESGRKRANEGGRFAAKAWCCLLYTSFPLLYLSVLFAERGDAVPVWILVQS